MKQYIGTKTIQACPMTSLKAEEMLERKLSDVEEDGYLVKYEDGYLSWSPKSPHSIHQVGKLQPSAEIHTSHVAGPNGYNEFVYPHSCSSLW